MKNSQIHQLDSGEFALKGSLTFETVNDVLVEVGLELTKSSDMVIDLAQVEKIDSAGLVFLLESQVLAKKHQQQLHFRHLSPSLISLAQVSNAIDLISMAD